MKMSNVPFFYPNQDVYFVQEAGKLYNDGFAKAQVIVMDGVVVMVTINGSFFSKTLSAAHKNHYNLIYWDTENLTVRRKPFQIMKYSIMTSKSFCGYSTVYFEPSVWISFNDLPVFKCVPISCPSSLKLLIFERLIILDNKLFQESTGLNSTPKTQAVYPKTKRRN